MEEAVHRGAISQGEITARFEKAFATYLGAVGGVATISGTSALVLALRTLGVNHGDDVVLPSFTCLAVLNAVVQVGARPVLADNECDAVNMDYNLTPAEVVRVLTPRTKVIIVPHMFGVPAKVDEIQELGKPVIEDITLSVGAVHNGKPVGARGALSVCSFHVSKMLTSGEGGMLTASSFQLLSRARLLNGYESEQAALRFGDGFPEPYELRYNFHLGDIASSLGLSQLSRLDRFVKTRRSMAQKYTAFLGNIEGVETPVVNEKPNIFFRYLVFSRRFDLVKVLRAYSEAGIEAGRGVYPALHRYIGEDPARFPGAERAMSGLLSIPLYPALRDEEIAYLLNCSSRILSAAPAK